LAGIVVGLIDDRPFIVGEVVTFQTGILGTVDSVGQRRYIAELAVLDRVADLVPVAEQTVLAEFV